MKKEKSGRESLRRLKPTVGCNASKGEEKQRQLLIKHATKHNYEEKDLIY